MNRKEKFDNQVASVGAVIRYGLLAVAAVSMSTSKAMGFLPSGSAFLVAAWI